VKYDLILAPGSSAEDIAISYEGVKPALTEEGELLLKTSVNTITEARPYSYQIIDGVEVEVKCSFVLKNNKVSFKIGDYDADLELVIDPILKFSTFSGSLANNFGYTAAFDQAGFLYSGSSVFSQGYPTTTGAYDTSFNGVPQSTIDYGISKFDTTGTFLVYSTYIGGSGDEVPHSIIVNQFDEIYIFGTTGSANYPTSADAYDDDFNGGPAFVPNGLGIHYNDGADIFVSKLSFDGSELLASTYIGGNGSDGLNSSSVTKYNYADEIRGEIELDADGNVLIASSTSTGSQPNDFPTTTGVLYESFLGGSQDGVIFKFDANLSDLMWSTYFGGDQADAALSITFNEANEIIVCGGSKSSNLPTTPGALQSDFQGGDADAWVLVMDENAENVIHCTYWGTEEFDQAFMVELDMDGHIHLFGQTFDGDFFIQNADYSVPNSGQFISKLSADLSSVIWSTAFGNGNGEPNISPTAFLVDLCDRIYLSGWGGTTGGIGLTTTDLPITDDAYQSTTDGSDFYLMTLLDDGSDLLYATYFGGNQSAEHVDGGTSRFDRKGKVYQSVCAGCGGNNDFPYFPADALSDENGSGLCNLGVFKMDFELPAVIADFIYTPICLPDTAVFTNTSVGGITYTWDFGDNETANGYNAAHFYDVPGLYTVTLIMSDPLSCNLADTIMKDIFIFDPSGVQLADTTICQGESVQIGFEPLILPGLTYSWTNAGLLDDSNISNPTATVTESTLFTVTIDNGICPSTATQFVEIQSLDLSLSSDTVICDESEITLFASSSFPDLDYVWSSNPDFSDTLSTTEQLTVTPLFGSTYYLAAEDECRVESSVTVTLFSSLMDLSANQYICAGDEAMLSVLTPLDESEYTVTWSPSAPIITGQGTDDILMTTSEDIWMTASIESIHGCAYVDSVLVEVSPLSFLEVDVSGDPLLIPLGGSSQLLTEPLGYNYTWTPSDGLSSTGVPNPVASPPGTTTYTVTVSDNDLNGSCAKSDTITIKVFEFQCAFPTVFLPNAFSPNEDGQNDVLFVRGSFLEEINLKIYDRWGELVFETSDKNIGWDGTFKGRRLDPAVYVYHLNMTCIDGQENFEKGNVTLIR
jgi:gliding motility-associated-like protein